jgi:glycerophosphoryl diester phosphodiesterase
VHRPRRLALLLTAAAFLLVAWYGAAWVRHIPADGPTAAIAHRGGPATSGTAEGTLEAFRAAIDAGADWLEFDVRSTSDGVLVVMHDETVDRTTDGTGPVSSLTLEAVRALDAGGGARVPTVEEVVALAASAGVRVLPEVKDGAAYPEVAGQLVDLLRTAGYLDRAVIQSSDTATLLRLGDIAPEAATCWITGLWQLDLSSPPGDAAYVCPMGEMLLLNPDSIRGAHAAGRRVFAWWSRAESGATDAILEAYGVDGLILDDLRGLATGDE